MGGEGMQQFGGVDFLNMVQYEEIWKLKHSIKPNIYFMCTST